MSQKKPATFPAESYIKIVEGFDEAAGQALRKRNIDEVQACIDKKLRAWNLISRQDYFGLRHVWLEFSNLAMPTDAKRAYKIDQQIDHYLHIWIIPEE